MPNLKYRNESDKKSSQAAPTNYFKACKKEEKSSTLKPVIHAVDDANAWLKFNAHRWSKFSTPQHLMWFIKQHFYHEKPLSECLPSANNPELRRMLLVAHGSLCLVDTTDAALRSGGNMIQFMLRSNVIAWVRFGNLALKELKACYDEGGLDTDAVDDYLDREYERMITS